MCTAINLNAGNNYFGRNLDYEYDFGQKVVITPRNYTFSFTNGKIIKHHFALIGMALVSNNYPLYFDATNEKGVSMAGLNFPGNAFYNKCVDGKDNVASFEFIPWILSQSGSVKEARHLLSDINVTDTAFSKDFAPSPLHWIIADKSDCITVESTKDGLFVYDNKVGVLTNNPEFCVHMANLENYMSVTAREPQNRFSDKIELKPHSRGMGGIGLPGDLSSMSRFVRCTFTKLNSIFEDTEQKKVNQFFHILESVYQVKGCAQAGDKFEMTNYSSCCNTDMGVYYYKTYYNSTINAVSMQNEDLETHNLLCYDLIYYTDFQFQN